MEEGSGNIKGFLSKDFKVVVDGTNDGAEGAGTGGIACGIASGEGGPNSTSSWGGRRNLSQSMAWSVILLLECASLLDVRVGSGGVAGKLTGGAKVTRDGWVPPNKPVDLTGAGAGA